MPPTFHKYTHVFCLQSELGESANTKRPTSCVLINTEKPWEGRSKADDVIEEAKKLLPQL